MAESTTVKPVLLIRKLGGVLLLICGMALTALAYSEGSAGLIAFGILLVVAGGVLMVLKIARRKQGVEI